MISSETASLAGIKDTGGTVTWFGTHLEYFLRPADGYNPKFATGWTVRVAAAESPGELTSAPEAVLGVTGTADVYEPDVRLDQLADLPLSHCAMLNNPTLFTQNGTLYLIVECLAFEGTQVDFANSTMQVFAALPNGEPSTWTWRHAGLLAGASLAAELGSETIQQPDVSLAEDGTLILIVTAAHLDENIEIGTAHDGCIVLS